MFAILKKFSCEDVRKNNKKIGMSQFARKICEINFFAFASLLVVLYVHCMMFFLTQNVFLRSCSVLLRGTSGCKER